MPSLFIFPLLSNSPKSSPCLFLMILSAMALFSSSEAVRLASMALFISDLILAVTAASPSSSLWSSSVRSSHLRALTSISSSSSASGSASSSSSSVVGSLTSSFSKSSGSSTCLLATKSFTAVQVTFVLTPTKSVVNKNAAYLQYDLTAATALTAIGRILSLNIDTTSFAIPIDSGYMRMSQTKRPIMNKTVRTVTARTTGLP